MSDFKLFGDTFAAMKRTVDARMKYQKVIAGNIANAETPGFVPRRVNFDKALREAKSGSLGVSVTHPGHISRGSSSSVAVEIDRNAIAREDGNAVNVDTEMVEMTTNQVMFDAGVNSINKKIGLMHYIVQEVR